MVLFLKSSKVNIFTLEQIVWGGRQGQLKLNLRARKLMKQTKILCKDVAKRRSRLWGYSTNHQIEHDLRNINIQHPKYFPTFWCRNLFSENFPTTGLNSKSIKCSHDKIATYSRMQPCVFKTRYITASCEFFVLRRYLFDTSKFYNCRKSESLKIPGKWNTGNWVQPVLKHNCPQFENH